METLGANNINPQNENKNNAPLHYISNSSICNLNKPPSTHKSFHADLPNTHRDLLNSKIKECDMLKEKLRKSEKAVKKLK